ncbi:MAG: EAL domain-containing protein [Parvularculaceae bacterium]|nr:EAL domain-containing protein [Parvularculaceae bacterium]
MVAQAVRLSNLDIDNALKSKDFEVLFQPIFDLGNGAFARVETFIRWRHPTLGVLPPGAFISFFETQGRMSELTRYVLSEALTAYKNWRGPFAPGFSINLALSDLSDESFPSHFSVLMRDAGFPVELVTLECPMPPVDADTNAVARQLQRLAATGARLAIEVRGRANEFLNTIDPFPFAEIKTGGAAILRFARTVRGPGLSAISELIDLAAQKNAAITAVGVEDQASLAALKGLGFAAAQGNHLGKVGALTQFMPSDVNEVRAHLGLEPLSSEDLAALFRTGAPALPQKTKAAPPDAELAGDDETEIDDQDVIVERLAARIARTSASAQEKQMASVAPGDKAAAIVRAKRLSAARDRIAAKNALKEKAEAATAQDAARDMQDRLTREFEALAEPVAPDDPAPAEAAEPIDPPTDEIQVSDAAVELTPSTNDGVADSPPAPAPAAMTGAAAAAAIRRVITSRMPVGGASARFVPTLRVSGAEGVAPPPATNPRQSPYAAQAPAPAPEELIAPTTDDLAQSPSALPGEPAPAELLDQEIPAVSPSTAWVEETVAIAENFSPRSRMRKRRRKSRLILGFIRYNGHFWPRPIREWQADQKALREARMLDE